MSFQQDPDRGNIVPTSVPTNSDDALGTKTTSGTTGNIRKENQSQLLNPIKRQQNPLGSFSSYTYQITLYMVTADAYNSFILSGRKDLNVLRDQSNFSGAYIVAQSAGVNNTNFERAPGLELDYYIDDLRIITSTNGKASSTASNVTEMTFNIYEPYGFSFISKVNEAAKTLMKKSKLQTTSIPRDNKTVLNQFFILGIRFFGYDESGQLIKSGNSLEQDRSGSTSNNGLFERFYDIYVTSMKFNLSGNTTVYNVKVATTSSLVAYGYKHGRVDTNASIVASTVQDSLIGEFGLLTQLNASQTKLYESNTIAIKNIYDVKFIGPDVTYISNAKLATQQDLEKLRYPMAVVKKSPDVNEYTSIKSTPDPTKKSITFRSDISIQQAIENIIKQSTFLSDSLKFIYDTTSDTLEDINNNKTSSKQTPIRWYNLSSEIQCLGWDNLVKDWAYKITYIIRIYETPFIQTPYIGKNSRYYGPHKRYQYYFTGQNSEIISYEQTFNNLWFNVDFGYPKTKTETITDEPVPMIPNKATGTDRTGRLDIGSESQNNFVNSLYDPSSWVSAKLQIIGDPDFLIQDNPGSIDTLYRQYYGYDGFTIDANGGQVFIEIDFKEAIDYNNSKGTLDINDQLIFWKYPDSVKKIVKGVSYMVNQVESNFSKGKFTQDMKLVLNTFPGHYDTTVVPRDGEEAIAAADRTQQQQDEALRLNLEEGAAIVSGFPIDKPVNTNINNDFYPEQPISITYTSDDDSSGTRQSRIIPPDSRVGVE